MERIERGWNEFWAELFRVKHRRSIQGIQQYDEIVVDFCIESLDLEKGHEILDIACGSGDQSIEFAKRGIEVTGFDISQSLINFAEENAKNCEVNVNFYQGDMREIKFDNRFKAAVLLSHSFGFFNHEENKLVLEGSYKALVDGGKLLLDLMNPYRLPTFQKTWTQLETGILLSEPHTIDAPAGVLRGRPATFIDLEEGQIVLMDQDAMSNNDIRMYTALEIQSMLKDVGFNRIEFYGQNKLPRMPYSATSERMVVVATK
ncbi:MAG: class I SAM-dependent methyltransferase [Candidatus Thorarchaeota archaeon]